MTALVFALCLPALVTAIGMATDVGLAVCANQDLQQMADAAVLATVSRSAINSVQGGMTNTAALQQIGQNVFNTSTTNFPNVSFTARTVSVVGQVGSVTATARYTGAVATYFSQFVGLPTLPVSGTAQATVNTPSYIDFYFLLDVSQSMGLGATTADMTKLASLTGGCAFACHQGGYDNYAIARQNGVNLRIDALKSALGTIIGDAQTKATVPYQYRIGLYTLAEWGMLGQPYPISSNLTAAATAASAVDLGPVQPFGDGQTYYDTTMPVMTGLVGSPGDGTQAATAKKFVFLITDGVEDEFNPGAVWGHYTAPFDPNLCAALKARGVTMAVIYTTYLAMPERGEWTTLVQPFAAQIGPNLKSCASPGYYFEANDGPAIATAMNALFTAALKSDHLTQ